MDTKTKIILLNKVVGETPLACIERFRIANPKFGEIRLSYAGRLDPMAEGLLLVLVGEENKRREEYQKLRKEYEVKVLFGIQTDTYDILGKIVKLNSAMPSKEEIEAEITGLVRKKRQYYPPYSSKTVNGKPLYFWARKKMLLEIEIPKKEIEIFSAKLLNWSEIESLTLKKQIGEKLEKVVGEFRQAEIKKEWKEFFNKSKDKKFQMVTLRIECSSGTYMRSIANDFSGITLSIKRVSVGNFLLKDAEDFRGELVF